MRLRRREKNRDALAVEPEPLRFGVERDHRVERLARRLAELHSRSLAHAPQRQRASLVGLTVEPLDRQVAQLFDLVEPTAGLSDVRQRDANLRELGGRRRVARGDLEIEASGAVRVHAIRHLRRHLRRAIRVGRFAGGIEVKRDLARAIRMPPLERQRDARVQLPFAIARNRLDQTRRRSRRARRRIRPVAVRTSGAAARR